MSFRAFMGNTLKTTKSTARTTTILPRYGFIAFMGGIATQTGGVGLSMLADWPVWSAAP